MTLSPTTHREELFSALEDVTGLPQELYKRLAMESGNVPPIDITELEYYRGVDRNSYAIKFDRPESLNMTLGDSAKNLLIECSVYDSVGCFVYIVEYLEERDYPGVEATNGIKLYPNYNYLRQLFTQDVLRSVYMHDAYKIAVYIYNTKIATNIIKTPRKATGDHVTLNYVYMVISYRLLQLGELKRLQAFIHNSPSKWANLAQIVIRRGTMEQYETLKRISPFESIFRLESNVDTALEAGSVIFLKEVTRNVDTQHIVKLPRIDTYSRFSCTAILLRLGFNTSLDFHTVEDFNNIASRMFMLQTITKNLGISLEDVIDTQEDLRSSGLIFRYLDHVFNTSSVRNLYQEIGTIFADTNNIIDGRIFIWYVKNESEIKRRAATISLDLGYTVADSELYRGAAFNVIGQAMEKKTLEEAIELLKADHSIRTFFHRNNGVMNSASINNSAANARKFAESAADIGYKCFAISYEMAHRNDNE